MTYHKKLSVVIVSVAVIITFLVGCGVSQKKMDDAEARIKTLETQGVPDSLLSSAKVFLFQAKSATKSSNSAFAKKYADSLFIYLERAEAEYQNTMQQFKPFVDSLSASITQRKKQLSGLQLQMVDSLIVEVDSFVKMNWLIQAKEKIVAIDAMFPQLIKDEERIATIRPKLIGTWSSSRAPEGGYKGVEKRRYSFMKDGKFTSEEEMKGQTAETLKEDWRFLTWGKYDLRGDTILLYVEREKCTKQTFWNYMKKNGKAQWVKNEAPTYDSTLTNHSKDKYMTFEYLLEMFKKK